MKVMDKVSKIDFDTIVSKICDSEIGIVLLEADTKSIYDILSEKTTYEVRQGMYANGKHVTYHLYPLIYNKKENRDIDSNIIHSRSNAILNIFKRWDELGYNQRHAKDPYSSKVFMKYLDEIEFLKADYMLLMVS